MEITVTVNAPELAGAITKLALAIEGAALNKNGEITIPAGTTATVQSVERVVQPTPAQQTTAQPQQKALTLNDIATAGAGLVDQGKMQQVIELLGKYGVQAITQLQPTQFDAFAGELRALGAAI
jgi:hypothetical protein